MKHFSKSLALAALALALGFGTAQAQTIENPTITFHTNGGSLHVDAIVAGSPVVGTPGATGAQGEQGIPGIAGVDGKDGLNGTNGLNGLNGLNGTNGIDGTDRLIGIGTAEFSGSGMNVYHDAAAAGQAFTNAPEGALTFTQQNNMVNITADVLNGSITNQAAHITSAGAYQGVNEAGIAGTVTTGYTDQHISGSYIPVGGLITDAASAGYQQNAVSAGQATIFAGNGFTMVGGTASMVTDLASGVLTQSQHLTGVAQSYSAGTTFAHTSAVSTLSGNQFSSNPN